MTDLVNIQKEIIALPFLRDEFPVGFQLGIPQLELMQDVLCLKYLPHKTIFDGKKIRLFKPSYRLRLLFPGLRIIEFSNLLYANGSDTNSLDCSVLIDDVNKFYENSISIFQRCAAVIDLWSCNHDKNVIAEYNAFYDKRLCEMGISKIYFSTDKK